MAFGAIHLCIATPPEDDDPHPDERDVRADEVERRQSHAINQPRPDEGGVFEWRSETAAWRRSTLTRYELMRMCGHAWLHLNGNVSQLGKTD